MLLQGPRNSLPSPPLREKDEEIDVIGLNLTARETYAVHNLISCSLVSLELILG